ncbi:MAG: isopenicillin-N N-acyltransferase like protein, partial [Caldanaerobacter sp.]|nr:isopenicillin-N N-acyltransferase like protein [Caldanaerobacter sp.]
MSKPYPFLKLEAPPVERGRLLGQTFKNKINSSIENYKRMFKDFSGINWDEAKKRALEFLPFIKEYSPKAIEEIEGIAEGSQEDFESILTLNCRSEIVLDSYVDGCTAFGLSSNITSDSKTYICQNWDWIRQQHDSLVVIEIKQPPEPTILMIAEAGIISGKGINSAGVGVGFNALTTGQGTLGVPVHFILRKILDSRHLADTVKA